jgi:hypothetical protein
VAIAVQGEIGAFATEPPPFALPAPPPGAARDERVFSSTFAMRAMPLLEPAKSATEDLGEQVLEGMLARGTRQTQTIPAGAMGNERPIEVVAEQWYSADIEAVVSRRNYDPRFGETTYRLVNVVRGEPPPDLFTVPQNYELQTERAPQVRLHNYTQNPGEPARERVIVMPSAPTDDAP